MELDVVFRNKEQQKLIGTLSYPESTGPCPGIVICHGFTGNRDGHFYPALSQALNAAGFAVLRFDCRHCGRSEGKVHSTYKTMVDDLDAAIAFLEKQERVTQLGVCGHSMGGTSVIMAAAHDFDLKAVVTFAAVAYPGKSVAKKRDEFTKQDDGTYVLEKHGRTFFFDESFFTDGEATKPLEAVARLEAPLLVIHGTDDDRISLDQGKQLFLTAKLPKSIKMIEGANHVFTDHYNPLITSTVRFFKTWMLEKE
ncbi:alpha/beta fold hydrolase [Candidatus Woesearchaeota archaeon]|nr:alpha/beta fold hydrolase [Candidatus Woesearchaeota archaeon]